MRCVCTHSYWEWWWVLDMCFEPFFNLFGSVFLSLSHQINCATLISCVRAHRFLNQDSSYPTIIFYLNCLLVLLNWLPSYKRCKVINFTFKHINYTYASGSELYAELILRHPCLFHCSVFCIYFFFCIYGWICSLSISLKLLVDRVRQRNGSVHQPEEWHGWWKYAHTICLLFAVCCCFFSRVVNKQEKWFRFMSTISFFCCMLYANQVKPCAAPASKFTGKILRTHSFRVWLFLSSLIFHHSDNNHENKICDLVSLLITWIRIDAW